MVREGFLEEGTLQLCLNNPGKSRVLKAAATYSLGGERLAMLSLRLDAACVQSNDKRSRMGRDYPLLFT